MKTLTVTEVARNFSAVMDGVESDGEEIVIIRNQRAVARLVPEPPEQTALTVLGDLCRTLDDQTADSLVKAVDHVRKARRGTLKQLRDPWAT